MGPGRVRAGRRRGSTLVEVVIAAGLTSLVLVTSVGVYLTGMKSWVRGQANIDALSGSQRTVRYVSNELREAMEVTVTGGGTGVAYKRPARDGAGAFVTPLVWDGVSRSFTFDGSNLVMAADGVSRTLAKDVLSREPASGEAYALFSAPPAAVSRSLTIKLVCGKSGGGTETVVNRSRETVYLRNVPQLSR